MRSVSRASYFFSANHAPGPISAAPTRTASTIKLQSGGRHAAARTSSRCGRGTVGEADGAALGKRDGAEVEGSGVGAKLVDGAGDGTAVVGMAVDGEGDGSGVGAGDGTAVVGAGDGNGVGSIVGAAVVGEGDGSGVGSIEGMNVTVGPGLGARDGGADGTLVVGAALGSDVVG